MYINTTGVVLRETIYKESSKILTLLTGGEGKITVTAHGAVRRNSKLAAATQLLAFSEMTLYSRRDRWTMTEARSVEQFIGLRDDIALLALGSYIAELTEAVADEDSPNPELLPLCLNALFALSERISAPEYVKPAFELRLMAVSGFAPLIGQCSACGAESPEQASLDIHGGTIRCAACCQGGGPDHDPGGGSDSSPGSGAGRDPQLGLQGHEGAVALGKGALRAARYIIGSDAKRLFSFTLGDSSLRELATATEGYLLAHLDRRFRTLDYYYRVK